MAAAVGLFVLAIGYGGSWLLFFPLLGLATGATLTPRPGLMQLPDLAAYQAPYQDPTHVNYRGLDVYGMAPSSSGGSTMGEALNQHANEAFEQLETPERKRTCEKLFKALTDLGTDPRGIRRPLKLTTLSARQADYLGVAVEGPYKADHYRY